MAGSDGFESAEEEESPPSPPDQPAAPPVEEISPAADKKMSPPSGKEKKEEVVKEESAVEGSAIQQTSPSKDQTPSPSPPEPKAPTPAPTEPQAPIPEPQAPIPTPQQQDSGGWGSWGGGWGSWAASSMSTVTKIAGETTKGLSGAFETFEASLGLPTPEELAREMKDEKTKEVTTADKVAATPETTASDASKSPPTDTHVEDKEGYYPGAGLWSGLAALSTTGTQYLNSGLDALEKASNQAYDALNYDVEGPKLKVCD